MCKKVPRVVLPSMSILYDVTVKREILRFPLAHLAFTKIEDKKINVFHSFQLLRLSCS